MPFHSYSNYNSLSHFIHLGVYIYGKNWCVIHCFSGISLFWTLTFSVIIFLSKTNVQLTSVPFIWNWRWKLFFFAPFQLLFYSSLKTFYFLLWSSYCSLRECILLCALIQYSKKARIIIIIVIILLFICYCFFLWSKPFSHSYKTFIFIYCYWAHSSSRNLNASKGCWV